MTKTIEHLGVAVCGFIIGFLALGMTVAYAATVTIEHPDPGTTASAQESVYGSVSEAPDSVSVTYSGPSNGTACASANIDALTWDCTWNTSSLASGTYSLQANATIGGVVSSSGTVSVVVSNASAATAAPASTGTTNTGTNNSTTTAATATPKTKTAATPASGASVTPSASPSAETVTATSDDNSSSKSNLPLYAGIAAAVILIGGVTTFLILRARKKVA